jgi:transposase-like protein
MEEIQEHGLNQRANDWITCKCGKLFSDSRKGRVTAKEKMENHLLEASKELAEKIKSEMKNARVVIVAKIERKIMPEIDDIHLTVLTRQFNKRQNQGEKAGIWVCGLTSPSSSSTKTKCEECGRDCYFIDNMPDMIEKKHKKICGFCVLKNPYRKSLNEEQIRVLEFVTGRQKGL